MQPFERYWLFAVFCLVIGLLTLRLILRERITLQGSLSLLGFLLAMGGVALFPGVTSALAQRMGFTLPSNFFFAVSIAILAVLYLGSQVTISRIELRTVALTQELGLLREQLERATTANKLPLQQEALHTEKPAAPSARRIG